MERAKWYKLHSWVGLKLSILLCFVLITGTFAVLSHEIDWLTNPAMRVYSTETKAVNWNAVYKNAQAQFPQLKLSSLSAPIDPWFAVEALYTDGKGYFIRGFFHPQSGIYQGDGRWYNWQRFFRMTHRHLMMPLNIGITLVCLAGLLLLGSVITGLVIYKNFYTGFFRWPRRTNNKVFWGDLHRLVAVWGLWLAIIIGITGIWYLVEQWGGRATYPDNGQVMHQPWLVPDKDRFAQMHKRLVEEFPAMRLATIRFPGKNSSVVVFDGQADTLLVRERANNMVFDGLTGDILSIRRAEDLSIHVRISEAADPLHFGTFGGTPTKVIYFIFGVLLSSLAVIGTYLYGLRVTRQHRGQAISAIWPNILKGMSYWKWLALILISICLSLTTYIFGFSAVITG